jgi:hypothetical protein
MLLERLQALQQGRLIVAATRGAFRPTTDSGSQSSLFWFSGSAAWKRFSRR